MWLTRTGGPAVRGERERETPALREESERDQLSEERETSSQRGERERPALREERERDQL